MIDGVMIKEKLQFKLESSKNNIFPEDIKIFSGYIYIIKRLSLYIVSRKGYSFGWPTEIEKIPIE